jgi:hypothetical protein
MTPTALKLSGALAAYLAPRIAADQRLPPLAPLVAGVNRENYGAMRSRVAARVRNSVRGRIAMDVDLDDLEDLLSALEEIAESEEQDDDEPEGRERNLVDPRREDTESANGRDDPNGFGGPGYGDPSAHGWRTADLEGPASLYSSAPLDCTDPSAWESETSERQQQLGSTGSEAIDRRIAANADRRRRAADARRAVIDRMRKIVRDALSGQDQPPPFEGQPPVGAGREHHNRLETDYPPVDRGAQDRRRVVGDTALDSRSRMLHHARRIGLDAVAIPISPISGVSAAHSSTAGANRGFVARFPGAARIKL